MSFFKLVIHFRVYFAYFTSVHYLLCMSFILAIFWMLKCSISIFGMVLAGLRFLIWFVEVIKTRLKELRYLSSHVTILGKFE